MTHKRNFISIFPRSCSIFINILKSKYITCSVYNLCVKINVSSILSVCIYSEVDSHPARSLYEVSFNNTHYTDD